MLKALKGKHERIVIATELVNSLWFVGFKKITHVVHHNNASQKEYWLGITRANALAETCVFNALGVR